MGFSNTTPTCSVSVSSPFTEISSMASIGILVALSILALVIHKYFNNVLPGALPPGPKSLPVIGCLHLIVINKPVFRWLHQVMEKLNTDIGCFRLGGVHVITVTSPQLAHEFLRNQDKTFCSTPVHVSTALGNHGYLMVVLAPYGNQWKKMRRIVTTEVLSPHRHNWLQNKRMEEADNLTHWVYNLCTTKGGIVNVRTVARHYCGNVIGKVLLNKRFFGKATLDGGPGAEEIEYVDAIFNILGHINNFSVSDYLPWLRIFDFDRHQDILRTALESISKYNDPIIDERIQDRTQRDHKSDGDILDILIQLTDPSTGAPLLTSSEIKAQILELMPAALDNPSHATEWALAEMINQPEMLRKAVQEIDEVVGRERLVNESDLAKLNYVKACAREAFRLHPVSAFNVPHASTADANVAGYFIPKGSHVLISRLSLGRNPRTWKDPLVFRPERHLQSDGSRVVLVDPDLGLFSFGVGRRGCPGIILGSTMTIMLLARLVQGFTWSTPPDMSCNNLAESEHNLTLAQPLLALAQPRLPTHVYPAS